MPNLTLLCGDALAMLKTLPSDSVHCCVTSPPYYGLRDYGTATWEGGDPAHKHDRIAARNGRGGSGSPGKQTEGAFPDDLPAAVCSCGARLIDQQIGLERTLDAYLSRLVAVFGEVRRVLHPSGVCFVNIGDSYCNAGSRNNGSGLDGERRGGMEGSDGTWADSRDKYGDKRHAMRGEGIKHKDRLLVPFRLALALQADGWWVRDVICWAKRAPMPESVTDRCTQSWEPIFMLTKAARYYWDAEAVKEASEMTPQNRSTNGRGPKDAGFRPDRCPPGMSRGQAKGWTPEPGRDYESGQSRHGNALEAEAPRGSRNLRNVWLLSPSPYPDAHFATFVPEIPKRCILAGTSAKGVCPKCGEPWVRVVERETVREHGGTRQMSKTPLPVVRAGWRNGGPPVRELGWVVGCDCNAGDPVPATVLDPFAGTFTTGAVALDLGRRAIGIELSEEYVKLAERRCAAVTPGLALA